jgi:hypothetical protein
VRISRQPQGGNARIRHRRRFAHPDRQVVRALKNFQAVDLGGLAINAALEKSGISGDQSTT